MKFNIETAKLNAILSAVAKGVGNKYTLPITEYLYVSLQDNVLSITSTDTTNFVTYTAKEVEGDNGEAIVKADQLIKLSSKTSKKEMKFNKKDACLEVKGNGTYKVELLEDGEYPTYEFNSKAKKVEIDTQRLKQIFNTNASAIADELTVPCLTGYNVGEKVVTTDGLKMCLNDVKIFDKPVLIPQALADLLSVINTEKVTIQKSKGALMFKTDHITIFGSELDGLDEYPDITPFLDIEYTKSAKVSKHELMKALDRLSLFVDPFDNFGVKLTFKSDSILIEDLKQNSQESLEVSETNTKEDFTVSVNIDLFKDLLNVLHEQDIVIEYGEELPLKIVENEVVQILSPMDDE